MSEQKAFATLPVRDALNFTPFGFYATKPTRHALFSIELEDLVPITTNQRFTSTTTSDVDDFAMLPEGANGLILESHMRAGRANKLVSNADRAVAHAHADFFSAFEKMEGLYVLAERYVMNLVNGSVLGANYETGTVRCGLINRLLTANTAQPSLSSTALSLADISDNEARADVAAIVTVLAETLAGKQEAFGMHVNLYVEKRANAEVYPSKISEPGQPVRLLTRSDRIGPDDHVLLDGRAALDAVHRIDTWSSSDGTPRVVKPFPRSTVINLPENSNANVLQKMAMLLKQQTVLLQGGTLSNEALLLAARFARGM